MRIAEASFAPRRLDEQKAFYGDVLGLPPVEDDGRIAVFGVGTSRLLPTQGRPGMLVAVYALCCRVAQPGA